MNRDRLEVQPITGTIGAEIHGVDISSDLSDETIGQIRRALVDHCVIFFRDQKLDVEQHKKFCRRFGEIFLHPNHMGLTRYPGVVDNVREPGDERIVGEDWHMDTTMVAEPPMGAVLYGVEIPPYGGDTLFANQYLAYETLSAGLKRTLEGLRAVHSDRMVAGPKVGMNAKRTTKIAKTPTGAKPSTRIPWCEPIRRAAASICTSMQRIRSDSKAGPRRRAGRC